MANSSENEEITRKIADLLAQSYGKIIERDDELYVDQFLTFEQKQRDKKITELLEEYVGSYKEKREQSRLFRKVLFWSALIMVMSLALCLIRYSWKAMMLAHFISKEQFGAFFVASVSLTSSIIGILTIITKYYFHAGDEKYITEIVKAIQKKRPRKQEGECS